MKQLFEVLGQIPTPGDFGIEVEVEGQNLPNVQTKTWKTEEDHSLRNGLEYVAKGAIEADKVEAALQALALEFKTANSVLDFSFRTSVHVHMNVQKLTFNQVANCIYTYLLIEDALMHYCGEQRKANRFCLRASDAEQLYTILEDLFRKGESGYWTIPKNKARYSALNIEALSKYGSLEFRGMEGNLDIPRISKWCMALQRLRSYACSKDNPMDIYNQFDGMLPERFLVTVLGDVAPYFEFPGLSNSFKRSFSLAITLPFAYEEGFVKRSKQKLSDMKKMSKIIFEDLVVLEPEMLPPAPENRFRGVRIEDVVPMRDLLRAPVLRRPRVNRVEGE